MDLNLHTTREYATVDDYSWLGPGNKEGPDTTLSISLDLSTFADADIADGYVRPGTKLGPITARPNVYGKYDPAAVDGRGGFAGHLYGTTQATDAGAGAPTIGAALLWQGPIVKARVPGGVDATALGDVTDANRCLYL
jgi:hypothetical protein